jgi:thiol-disulfide isomerase/thioredoxin
MSFGPRRRLLLLALAVAAVAAPVRADGIPGAYAPMNLAPALAPGRTEFDLGPALERARREKRPLYLYLGAPDCPYCRRYEKFLADNAAKLAPHFGKYLVVQLKVPSLQVTARELHFRIGGEAWNYPDFMRRLGDERVRLLVYPSVWLLDSTPKPLMQMPAGTGTFETVEEQLEILRLEN